MPQTYNDVGIVIRRVNYGEADRILTLLTQDTGKIGVIARGARRTKSSLGAATDLYVHGEFHFTKGRSDLDQVSHGVVQHSLPSGRSYAELLSAAVIAEITDRLIVDRAPDAVTYAHCEFAMSMLWEGFPWPLAVAGWYPLVLCAHLGYAPVMDRCISCGKPLPEDAALFVASLNGWCCRSCSGGGRTGVSVSVRALKVVRLALRAEPAVFFRLRFDDEICAALLGVSDALATEHAGRPLKSMGQLLRYVANVD